MTLKLRAGISTADVEYGTALLDEDRGEYWNLNPTGALVLERMLAGATREEAAHALAEEYGVDLDVATADVRELLEGLQSAGLGER